MDLNEVRELMRNVPFGNSQFQIQNFMEGLTPERIYRNVLLQLHQKLNALDECRLSRKRTEIDIEEVKEKLLTAKSFEAKRLEVDLEEKELQLKKDVKLIEDCLIEVQTYTKTLEGLPKYSREQFELAESGYWQKRLTLEADLELKSTGHISTGTLKSLIQIGAKINEQGQLVLKPLEALEEHGKG